MSHIENAAHRGREERWAEIKAVVALSIPSVITMSARAVNDFVDLQMVSPLGKEAVAAVLPAQMTVWCYIALGMGAAMTVTTFASQALGRNQLRECSAYAWQGLWLSLIFGVVGLALRFVLPGVFAWYGHEPQLQSMELAFATVLTLTIMPTVAAAALDSFFNGVHKPSVAMWAALEANVVNIFFNYCLIYGEFGFPQLGVTGAAWGTVIAAYYRLFRLSFHLLLPSYRRQFHSLETMRWSGSRAWDIVRVGGPTGCQWLSDVIVWTLFVGWLIGSYFSLEELTASNIAWRYMALAFMPALGVCRALSALVGKSIGQGRRDRARRYTRLALIANAGFMAMVGVAYYFFAAELIGLFSSDPTVIRAGIGIMVCAAIYQAFDGAGMTYVSALRGAGDTAWPAWMFIITHWVIIIGGGYSIVSTFPHWGALGPWIAAALLLVSTALLLGWRWEAGAWEKIDLFKDKKAPAEEVAAPELELEPVLSPAPVG